MSVDEMIRFLEAHKALKNPDGTDQIFAKFGSFIHAVETVECSSAKARGSDAILTEVHITFDKVPHGWRG